MMIGEGGKMGERRGGEEMKKKGKKRRGTETGGRQEHGPEVGPNWKVIVGG